MQITDPPPPHRGSLACPFCLPHIFFSAYVWCICVTAVPGETEQPPRAAVPDRDGEDAGLLRGGGVAKEGRGGKLQGELFGRVQPPWLPGAQRPSQVSLKGDKAVRKYPHGFMTAHRASRLLHMGLKFKHTYWYQVANGHPHDRHACFCPVPNGRRFVKTGFELISAGLLDT